LRKETNEGICEGRVHSHKDINSRELYIHKPRAGKKKKAAPDAKRSISIIGGKSRSGLKSEEEELQKEKKGVTGQRGTSCEPSGGAGSELMQKSNLVVCVKKQLLKKNGRRGDWLSERTGRALTQLRGGEVLGQKVKGNTGKGKRVKS